MSDARVIDLPETVPDWTSYGTDVRKIVVGELDRGEDKLTLDSLPDDLAERFPHLTHLYLWGIAELDSLPDLPPELACLDVRRCPDLERLAGVPRAALQTLVLEECPSLRELGALPSNGLPVLDDLSLKGCPRIPEKQILSVLQGSTALRKLDLSECSQVKRLRSWPAGLVELRLNGCAELHLLGKWPARLRRLELKRAVRVRELPDFPETLDYVNLAGTESLRKLPENRAAPRTLFLHGSGILMPPATEHGATVDENVAARTQAYFEDVALTGQGQVKRCKLLILGNGSAGKTCLSLALVPGGDPAQAAVLGTTHAVQFWPWEFEANVGGTTAPVHLDLWDFGGQEIYHSTHRLFMGKGAVFLVVWNPEQDGEEAPENESGYADEWRPLRYWLDLIHDACPHKPRIAVVCSHQDGSTVELRDRFEAAKAAFGEEIECFFVDSLHRRGDLQELREWLEDEVGNVVQEQGTAVPAYWEIAQEGVSTPYRGNISVARGHLAWSSPHFVTVE